MKHLLQAHGIKVTNNQIAKADIEKAINILSNVEVIDNINEKFDEILDADNIATSASASELKKIKNLIKTSHFELYSFLKHYEQNN